MIRSRWAAALAMSGTGGGRFGITIARANWRAVHGSTSRSIAPSRRWTCQSSGRAIVIESAADMGCPLLAQAHSGHRLRASIWDAPRSEEHTSELQSLMRISYAVFCLKKKKHTIKHNHKNQQNTD